MSQNSFPILFTLGNSNKHDVMLIATTQSIRELQQNIETIAHESPNCADSLAKYSKTTSKHTVTSIKVRWSGEPREAKLWPSGTILTKDNIEAVLKLVELHQGKDILEVEVNTVEEEKEKKKTSDNKSAEEKDGGES